MPAPHEKPQAERELLIARLEGYLDAANAVNGMHENQQRFVMSAALLDLRGLGVEEMLSKYLSGIGYRQIAISPKMKWTEVERFLNESLLSSPFGLEELSRLKQAGEARFRLAFQATDLVMFLAPQQEPRGAYRLTMSRDGAVSASGCAVLYENDLLLLTQIDCQPEAA